MDIYYPRGNKQKNILLAFTIKQDQVKNNKQNIQKGNNNAIVNHKSNQFEGTELQVFSFKVGLENGMNCLELHELKKNTLSS